MEGGGTKPKRNGFSLEGRLFVYLKVCTEISPKARSPINCLSIHPPIPLFPPPQINGFIISGFLTGQKLVF